jgi:transient receptor potential cation channel subfamily C protein 4
MCLQVLNAAWYGDWHEWRRRPEILKFLTIFPRMFLLPLIAVLCLVAPRSKLVAFHALPINKMLNSIASYLVFLVFVFLVSNQDKKNPDNRPPNSGTEFHLIHDYKMKACVFECQEVLSIVVFVCPCDAM